MSWSQDFHEAPPRPRYDVYLDGLVTGVVVTWLLMMLYEMDKRESFGAAALGVVVTLLAIVTVVKVVRMWKDGR